MNNLDNIVTININQNQNKNMYHDLVDAIFEVIEKYQTKEIGFSDPEKIQVISEPVPETYSPEKEESITKTVCTGFYDGGKKSACHRCFKDEQYTKAIFVINEIAKTPDLTLQEFAYRFCKEMKVAISYHSWSCIARHINYAFKNERRKDKQENHANCATLFYSGMSLDYARLMTQSSSLQKEKDLDRVPTHMVSNDRLIKFYLENKDIIDDYVRKFPGKFTIPDIPEDLKKEYSEETTIIAPVKISNKSKVPIPIHMDNLNEDIVSSLCNAYVDVLKSTRLAGDQAIAEAVKRSGYKTTRPNAKTIIFGHKFLDKKYESIATPTYSGVKGGLQQPERLRIVVKIKWLRSHGFDIDFICDTVGEKRDFVDGVYYERIYTQQGQFVSSSDERAWTIKYLNKDKEDAE